MTMHGRLSTAVILGGASLFWSNAALTGPVTGALDPGVRVGVPSSGAPLLNLQPTEMSYFTDGRTRFLEVEAVTGGVNNGLGPRFNSNQCASCHSQPSFGGSSPAMNPLFAIATSNGASNSMPWFITQNGPVREARFKLNTDGTADGGVHNLFVITGRRDAPTCNIAQPNFLPAGNPTTAQGGNPNIVFRIPTPIFGAGMIEAITDSTIIANMNANAGVKSQLGIKGHPNAHISGTANHNGNDGTITRFGWKAQNKSLLLFAGEAYNVEMGVTNQLFPQERDETPGCQYNPAPEDTNNFTGSPDTAVLSDIEAFANYMRMLAPPTPAPDTPAIISGRAAFTAIGCSACHTPALVTGPTTASSYPRVQQTSALSNQTANLFSDLILHEMGKGLADGIVQGGAAGDEFRTAPLWGLGQRIFFLHDGRTSNLVEAIEAHQSPGSEANAVVDQFKKAGPQIQQDLITFLRSL
jgi:CxxC motif-containing protein (DUF1111 family)